MFVKEGVVRFALAFTRASTKCAKPGSSGCAMAAGCVESHAQSGASRDAFRVTTSCAAVSSPPQSGGDRPQSPVASGSVRSRAHGEQRLHTNVWRCVFAKKQTFWGFAH